MKKKVIILFIIVLLVTTIPIVGAKYNEVKNERIINSGTINKFTDCYIEISGLLSDEDYPKLFNRGPFWKIYFLRLEGNGEPPSYVFYWYMRLDETAKITIKSEQNGDILWEHDGSCEQEIRILSFKGDYISTIQEDRSYKDISGHVYGIWLKDLK